MVDASAACADANPAEHLPVALHRLGSVTEGGFFPNATLSLAGGEYVLRFRLVGAADWQWVEGGTRRNPR